MRKLSESLIRSVQQVVLRNFGTSGSLSMSANTTSEVDGSLVSGPERPSDWWMHEPRAPNRRVARMYPVRYRHRPRIVLVREGCTNRPFFTIQIKSNLAETKQHGIEQVGSWDPYPNKTHGEQLIALNLDRIFYWLARRAEPSTRVAELLGLAGVLPVHPRSYLIAHRARLATAAYLERQKQQSESAPADVATEAANEAASEQDPQNRPDSVWRRGREPPWWWFNGLM